ncbi:hypothetical protein FB451DRAFT_1175968 [Mycena latifolia]|nr:hypothetical protein FB451DRAFT_1175968 [Mycena latifolia]
MGPGGLCLCNASAIRRVLRTLFGRSSTSTTGRLRPRQRSRRPDWRARGLSAQSRPRVLDLQQDRSLTLFDPQHVVLHWLARRGGLQANATPSSTSVPVQDRLRLGDFGASRQHHWTRRRVMFDRSPKIACLLTGPPTLPASSWDSNSIDTAFKFNGSQPIRVPAIRTQGTAGESELGLEPDSCTRRRLLVVQFTGLSQGHG